MTDVPTKAGDISWRDVGFNLVVQDGNVSVRAPIAMVTHERNETTIWVKLGEDELQQVPFRFAPDFEVRIADAQT